MQIALDLARKCSGFTFPNPPVGCVIVEYDKIKIINTLKEIGININTVPVSDILYPKTSKILK